MSREELRELLNLRHSEAADWCSYAKKLEEIVLVTAALRSPIPSPQLEADASLFQDYQAALSKADGLTTEVESLRVHWNSSIELAENLKKEKDQLREELRTLCVRHTDLGAALVQTDVSLDKWKRAYNYLREWVLQGEDKVIKEAEKILAE